MKRIISALLTVAMLVTMLVVPTMTVSAATYSHTSDLYSNTLPTRYAVKGTPTIDGDKSEWTKAYTYRVDRSQNALLGGAAPMGTMADVYMMWDENYLYILEERFNETIIANSTYYNFSNQGTAHYVVLPSDYTDDGVATNNGGTAMIYTIPAQSLLGSTTVGATGDSTINGRIKWYKDASLGTAQAVIVKGDQNYSVFAGDDATSWEGATSKTSLTETGYIMETRVPWNFLDQRCDEAFTPAADTVIGIGWNGGRKTNASFLHTSDTAGFQKLQLLGAGVENPTVKPIVPDLSWYDVSKSEFTITTAEQLLGLAELTNLHGNYAVWFKNNPKFGTDNPATLTAGKTFKLGANIDLNPGTTFNSDGTYTGTPLNGWGTIGRFAGTFDGQGYTISGIYVAKGLTNGSHTDELGFIGRMIPNGTIKNVKFTNGLLIGDGKDDIAGVVGVLHGNGKPNAGTLTISNVYSDMIVKGTKNSGFVGGIAGSAYTGNSYTVGSPNTATIVIEDCVFAGVISSSGTTPTLGAISSRLAWNSNYTVTKNDKINGVDADGDEATKGGNNITNNTGTEIVLGSTYHAARMNATISNCYDLSGSTLKTYGSTGGGTVTDNSDAAYIQETAVNEGKFDVRILGLIDEAELGLDGVGMKVTVTYTNGATTPATVTTFETKVLEGVTQVYKTVSANGTPVEVSTLEGDYEYAYGAVLTNIPGAETDTVKIDVVLTRVIDGVAVESTCTYSATYVGGVK